MQCVRASSREAGLRYLHTMLRVKDLDRALEFFVDGLGLEVVRRSDYEKGRFTVSYTHLTLPTTPYV